MISIVMNGSRQHVAASEIDYEHQRNGGRENATEQCKDASVLHASKYVVHPFHQRFSHRSNESAQYPNAYHDENGSEYFGDVFLLLVLAPQR